MSYATFPQRFILHGDLLILDANCLKKNTRTQLTVTIYSAGRNMSYSTLLQLFSLHSVLLILDANCLERNT